MDGNRRAIEGGLNVAHPNPAQIVALMRVLYEQLREAIAARSVNPVMDFLYPHLAQTLAKVGATGLACREGCFYCCTSWVTASAPEVLYVVRTVRTDQATTQRIALAAKDTVGKTLAERLRMITPCPILDDGLCGAYSVRPIVCRAAVSRSAVVCQRAYSQLSGEEIPRPFDYDGIKSVYALALAGAVKRAGLRPFYYEYIAALNAALNAADAEIAWLSGDDIFAGVLHDPQGEMFSYSWNQRIYAAAFP